MLSLHLLFWFLLLTVKPECYSLCNRWFKYFLLFNAIVNTIAIPPCSLSKYCIQLHSNIVLYLYSFELLSSHFSQRRFVCSFLLYMTKKMTLTLWRQSGSQLQISHGNNKSASSTAKLTPEWLSTWHIFHRYISCVSGQSFPLILG